MLKLANVGLLGPAKKNFNWFISIPGEQKKSKHTIKFTSEVKECLEFRVSHVQ